MAKKIITENINLTREELEILAKVPNDVFFFSLFCYVIHPVRGKVRFELYPYQKSVLYQFVKERFNILLKFRQAGITELISMYCLWLAMYHPNKKINIISIKDTTAKKVLKKIKFMYKNLPWYLQTPIINGRAGEFGSASMIEFDNGSFIESIPTSSEAGRSESLSLLVIDEAAIVRWAAQIWAAAFPTLSCSVGSTPVFLRHYEEIKKGYPKPITEQIKLRTICPKQKGVLDISNLGYYTLTHTGSWKKILWTQNKGKLETWFVKDNRGKKAGYTPKHRLFTTKGWKTVEEIIDQNLNVIQADTKVDQLKLPKQVKAPSKEILKPIEEYPGHFVSNLGKVYSDSPRKGFYELTPRPNKDGYLRVALKKAGVKRETGSIRNQGKGKTFQRSVHLLVAEAFLGPKPNPKSQVDHINNQRDCNHINNLRYISNSDNIKKSFEYNLNATLFGIQGDKLPNLLKRGRILEMAEEGFSYREIAREVYPEYKQAHKFVKRILTERGSRVYISKLQVVKKCQRTIYDIHVEDDNSYISANNYINHNTGGSAIVNSTPYGVGNFYHSTWVDAIAGGNPFNPIRLYWQMHPERDENWYKQMASALGPKRTAQEIDGDFLSSGNTVFDLADIKAIEDCLSDYPVIKKRFNGQYRQYLEPQPDKEYFIGADVSTGRASDYSAFTCMDKQGEEQAVYKGRMPLDKYARLLGDTGQLYNWATLAPESNDVGMAVTAKLQDEGYPKLYYYQKMLKKKGKSRPEVDKSPGWLTTQKNRSVIIENLEQDIREENAIIKDPFFVQEAYTFIYDGLGRPVAMGKHRANNSAVDIDLEGDVYSDDSIFGKAICNHIRKGKTNIIVQPK
nr:MAG: Terminase [Bacteriophage sp.]